MLAFLIICPNCKRHDVRRFVLDTTPGVRHAIKVFGPLVDGRGRPVRGRDGRMLRYWNQCTACDALYSAPPPASGHRLYLRRLERRVGQLRFNYG